MRFKKGDKVYAVPGNIRKLEGSIIIDNAIEGSYLVYKERDEDIFQLREAEVCTSQWGHEGDPCKLCGCQGWRSQFRPPRY